MAILPQQKEDIIASVVATFNAAPGAQFLQDFTSKIDAGMSLPQLVEFFVGTDQFKNGILKGVVTKEEIAKKLPENFGLISDNADPQSPAAQAEAFFNTRLSQGASISNVIQEADRYLRGTPAEEFKAIADLFKNKITVAEAYSKDKSANELSQLQAVLRNVTPTYPKTEADAEAFLSRIIQPTHPGGVSSGGVDKMVPSAAAEPPHKPRPENVTNPSLVQATQTGGVSSGDGDTVGPPATDPLAHTGGVAASAEPPPHTEGVAANPELPPKRPPHTEGDAARPEPLSKKHTIPSPVQATQTGGVSSGDGDTVGDSAAPSLPENLTNPSLVQATPPGGVSLR